jgi:hypothetical protein
MEFTFTKEQEYFREEIRDFCKQNMTPEIMSDAVAISGGGDTGLSSENFYRKMAEKGWLGMSWPVQYGGQGRSYVDMTIFAEEPGYAGAPMGNYSMTVAFVGNAIVVIGSDEHKKKYLPRIASGDMTVALGYTEPNAGTDLASLQLKAVADGDDFIMNGQKIFTTAAHTANWVLLATRTDPNAPKHRGITLFLLPLDSEGITIRPLWTMAHGRTNEVFYEDVRVPRNDMLGEQNRGWYHLATALDFERVGIGSVVGSHQRLLDDMIEYIKAYTANSVYARRSQVVRHMIAETATEIDVLRNMCYRIAWMQDNDIVPNIEASANKIYGTELGVRIAQRFMRILNEFGLLEQDEAQRWLPLANTVSNLYLATSVSTALAGSSEIQRMIIAYRGLGMPRG